MNTLPSSPAHSQQNKIAFVLGAGRGHGREAAISLAQAGAFVACFDFSPMHADQTAQAITATGGRAKAYSGDVIKKIALQTVFNQIADDVGAERIDILVSAVDIAPKAHMLRLDEWDWHRALDSNLTLPFLAAQISGRIMQTHGGGTMVFFGPRADQPASVVYRAGKQGLLGMVRHAAAALTGAHIRVHMLWPESDTAPPEALTFAEAAARAGVSPPPATAGDMVRWLASPEAEKLSGLVLKL